VSGYALLVAGGDHLTGAGLDELLAEADCVVAVDSGADVIVERGMSPDLVVGDMDSIDPGVLSSLDEAGVRLVRHPSHKDESDLVLALQLCREEGYAEVVVTGVVGGRVDHTLAAVGALARFADLRPFVRWDGGCGWVLSPNHRDEISLAGLGSTVSIFALGSNATVSAQGLRWALDSEVLHALDSRGLSNVVASEGATIRVHSGTVMVITAAVGAHGPAVGG
jgi:thiamine pyrophosphokinase